MRRRSSTLAYGKDDGAVRKMTKDRKITSAQNSRNFRGRRKKSSSRHDLYDFLSYCKADVVRIYALYISCQLINA